MPRYIKVAILLYDTKTIDLTGDDQDPIPSHAYINPMEIQWFRPASDKEGENPNAVLVHLKGGEDVEVQLSLKKFLEVFQIETL